MADDNTPEIQLPRVLEPPPKTTGNAQADYPLMVNWFYRAYQTILQIAQYIEEQVEEGAFDPENLPDPGNTTLAQAQDTANKAYELAEDAKELADESKALADEAIDDAADALAAANSVVSIANNALSVASNAESVANAAQSTANGAQSGVNNINLILGRWQRGTITLNAADTGASPTFGSAQPDTAYSVILQPMSSTGTPAVDAFIVTSKSYSTGGFSFTVNGAPGVGSTVTYEWQVVRST